MGSELSQPVIVKRKNIDTPVLEAGLGGIQDDGGVYIGQNVGQYYQGHTDDNVPNTLYGREVGTDIMNGPIITSSSDVIQKVKLCDLARMYTGRMSESRDTNSSNQKTDCNKQSHTMDICNNRMRGKPDATQEEIEQSIDSSMIPNIHTIQAETSSIKVDVTPVTHAETSFINVDVAPVTHAETSSINVDVRPITHIEASTMQLDVKPVTHAKASTMHVNVTSAAHAETSKPHADITPAMRAETSTLRHSDITPAMHAETSTLRHADITPAMHAETSTLRHADITPAMHAETSTLRPDITPVTHDETSTLHADITPSTPTEPSTDATNVNVTPGNISVVDTRNKSDERGGKTQYNQKKCQASTDIKNSSITELEHVQLSEECDSGKQPIRPPRPSRQSKEKIKNIDLEEFKLKGRKYTKQQSTSEDESKFTNSRTFATEVNKFEMVTDLDAKEKADLDGSLSASHRTSVEVNTEVKPSSAITMVIKPEMAVDTSVKSTNVKKTESVGTLGSDIKHLCSNTTKDNDIKHTTLQNEDDDFTKCQIETSESKAISPNISKETHIQNTDDIEYQNNMKENRNKVQHTTKSKMLYNTFSRKVASIWAEYNAQSESSHPELQETRVESEKSPKVKKSSSFWKYLTYHETPKQTKERQKRQKLEKTKTNVCKHGEEDVSIHTENNDDVGKSNDQLHVNAKLQGSEGEDAVQHITNNEVVQDTDHPGKLGSDVIPHKPSQSDHVEGNTHYDNNCTETSLYSEVVVPTSDEVKTSVPLRRSGVVNTGPNPPKPTSGCDFYGAKKKKEPKPTKRNNSISAKISDFFLHDFKKRSSSTSEKSERRRKRTSTGSKGSSSSTESNIVVEPNKCQQAIPELTEQSVQTKTDRLSGISKFLSVSSMNLASAKEILQRRRKSSSQRNLTGIGVNDVPSTDQSNQRPKSIFDEEIQLDEVKDDVISLSSLSSENDDRDRQHSAQIHKEANVNTPKKLLTQRDVPTPETSRDADRVVLMTAHDSVSVAPPTTSRDSESVVPMTSRDSDSIVPVTVITSQFCPSQTDSAKNQPLTLKSNTGSYVELRVDSHSSDVASAEEVRDEMCFEESLTSELDLVHSDTKTDKGRDSPGEISNHCPSRTPGDTNLKTYTVMSSMANISTRSNSVFSPFSNLVSNGGKAKDDKSKRDNSNTIPVKESDIEIASEVSNCGYEVVSIPKSNSSDRETSNSSIELQDSSVHNNKVVPSFTSLHYEMPRTRSLQELYVQPNIYDEIENKRPIVYRRYSERDGRHMIRTADDETRVKRCKKKKRSLSFSDFFKRANKHRPHRKSKDGTGKTLIEVIIKTDEASSASVHM